MSRSLSPAPDIDPTSQLAWPTSMRKDPPPEDTRIPQEDRYRTPDVQKKKSPQRDVNGVSVEEIGRTRLSTRQLFNLV